MPPALPDSSMPITDALLEQWFVHAMRRPCGEGTAPIVNDAHIFAMIDEARACLRANPNTMRFAQVLDDRFQREMTSYIHRTYAIVSATSYAFEEDLQDDNEVGTSSLGAHQVLTVCHDHIGKATFELK
jgi:hypothetical protein